MSLTPFHSLWYWCRVLKIIPQMRCLMDYNPLLIKMINAKIIKYFTILGTWNWKVDYQGEIEHQTWKPSHHFAYKKVSPREKKRVTQTAQLVSSRVETRTQVSNNNNNNSKPSSTLRRQTKTNNLKLIYHKII